MAPRRSAFGGGGLGSALVQELLAAAAPSPPAAAGGTASIAAKAGGGGATAPHSTVGPTAQGVSWSVWSMVCAEHADFNGRRALSITAACLAAACLFAGAVAMAGAYADRQHRKEPRGLRKSRLLVLRRFLKRAYFVAAVHGNCVNYMLKVVVDIMVIVSFAMCDYLAFMIVAATIKVLAQVFLAADYAASDEDVARPQPLRRALLSLLQVRVVIDSWESWEAGKVTHSYERFKFVESVVEAGPQAIMGVCMLCFFPRGSSPWLVLSIVSSVVSLAWGISSWLEVSAEDDEEESWGRVSSAYAAFRRSPTSAPPTRVREERIADALGVTIPPRTNMTTFLGEAGLADIAQDTDSVAISWDHSSRFRPTSEGIRWYHHCIWTSYFTMDFMLRVLTVGFFLSIGPQMHAWFPAVMVILLVSYFLAVVIPIQLESPAHRTPHVGSTNGGSPSIKFGRVVSLQDFKEYAVDGLILTFLVHVLPADTRQDPKNLSDSRWRISLRRDVRKRIMWIVIPLRALDYLTLGGVAMFWNYSFWQCTALVTTFASMHILLAVTFFVVQAPEAEAAASRASSRAGSRAGSKEAADPPGSLYVPSVWTTWEASSSESGLDEAAGGDAREVSAAEERVTEGTMAAS